MFVRYYEANKKNSKIITDFRDAEPLRSELIFKKITPYVDAENTISLGKKMQEIPNFDESLKINESDCEKIFEIFDLGSKAANDGDYFWEILSMWLEIYPRFEYPRFRDRFTNKHGIKPKFLKNGELNDERYEEECKKT